MESLFPTYTYKGGTMAEMTMTSVTLLLSKRTIVIGGNNDTGREEKREGKSKDKNRNRMKAEKKEEE